jgi:hypothetical protein
MEDIEFSYLVDDKIIKTTFQDITANKRVLFCSLTRPHEVISDNYAGYLQGQVDYYKIHGVDEIYFINVLGTNLLLHTYQNRIKKSSIQLLISNTSIVEHLRDIHNLTTKSVDFLSTYWNFQALFDNGKLEYFKDSPVIDPVKEAFKTNPGFMAHKIKNISTKENEYKTPNYLTEDPDLVLWIPNLRYMGPNVAKILFYNSIWPNNSLDQYLIDNKKQ